MLSESLCLQHEANLQFITAENIFSKEEDFQSSHKIILENILVQFKSNLSHGTSHHITSIRDDLIFRMKGRFEEALVQQREKRLTLEETMNPILKEFQDKMKAAVTCDFCIPKKYTNDSNLHGQNAKSKFKRALAQNHSSEMKFALIEFERQISVLKDQLLLENSKMYQLADEEASETIESILEYYNEELQSIGNGLQLGQEEVDKLVQEINDDVKQRFQESITNGPEAFISAKNKCLEDRMQKVFFSWFSDYKKKDESLYAEHKQVQEKLVLEIQSEIAAFCKNMKCIDDIYITQNRLITEALGRYGEVMLLKASEERCADLSANLTMDLKQAFILSAQTAIEYRAKETEQFHVAVNSTVESYQNLMKGLHHEDIILNDEYLCSNHTAIKDNCLLSVYLHETKQFEHDHPLAQDYLAVVNERIDEEFCTIQKKLNKVKIIFEEKTDQEIKHHAGLYQQSMMNQLTDIENYEHLERVHKIESNKRVSELRTSHSSLSIGLTDLKVERLKEILATSYSDISSGFAIMLETRARQTNSAILEARKLYESEMAKHKQNNKFSHPGDLKSFNERVNQLISTRNGHWKKFLPYQVKEIKTALHQTYKSHKKEFTMQFATDPAIGIDLGTTYTCVSVFHKGSIILVPNRQGKPLIPSYVKFNLNGEAEKVGIDAKDDAYVHAETTIFDAKRIIGRKYEDPQLQKSISLWPFNLVNKSGIPKFEIGTKHINPEEVSAEVLQEMKRMAEHHLGTPVTKAVITVPAKFNDGQRQATIDAGKCAGLKVIGLLTEPVAASYAFKLDKFEIPLRYVLIFDLGGGTFDVAVLKICSGKIETLAVHGDTHLGGGDFDHNMVNYCVDQFKKQTGVDLMKEKESINALERDDVRRRLHRLLQTCEEKKRALSALTCKSVEIIIPSICSNGQNVMDMNVTVARDTFNAINHSLFTKTIDIVKKCLESVNIPKEQIDDIVLVGGSTNILKIQEMLSKFFDGKALNYSINPDEAVSYGAAIYAAIRNGQIAQEDYLYKSIRDVTPMSIGVELVDGTLSVIIPRYTTVPAKIIKKDYITVRNNQTTVTIVTYQGEHREATKNDYLGEFTLRGIPPAPAGHEKIDVTMEVNEEGVLHVTAVCRSNGESGTITITEDKRRLTHDQIKEIRSKIGRRIKT